MNQVFFDKACEQLLLKAEIGGEEAIYVLLFSVICFLISAYLLYKDILDLVSIVLIILGAFSFIGGLCSLSDAHQAKKYPECYISTHLRFKG